MAHLVKSGEASSLLSTAFLSFNVVPSCEFLSTLRNKRSHYPKAYRAHLYCTFPFECSMNFWKVTTIIALLKQPKLPIFLVPTNGLRVGWVVFSFLTCHEILNHFIIHPCSEEVGLSTGTTTSLASAWFTDVSSVLTASRHFSFETDLGFKLETYLDLALSE